MNVSCADSCGCPVADYKLRHDFIRRRGYAVTCVEKISTCKLS